ncbi:MAG: hypothetical protein AB1659_02475 [Thermodesulfobacteriota bacterium]
MEKLWEKNLSCAVSCSRCRKSLKGNDLRILSVYDHHPICMECKTEEEARTDYENISKEMIGTCMADVELKYSDPGGYCYFHFYPFKC